MSNETSKKRTVSWVVAIGVFIVFSWLFANWDDFKTGLAGGYAEQTKSHP